MASGLVTVWQRDAGASRALLPVGPRAAMSYICWSSCTLRGRATTNKLEPTRAPRVQQGRERCRAAGRAWGTSAPDYTILRAPAGVKTLCSLSFAGVQMSRQNRVRQRDLIHVPTCSATASTAAASTRLCIWDCERGAYDGSRTTRPRVALTEGTVV